MNENEMLEANKALWDSTDATVRLYRGPDSGEDEQSEYERRYGKPFWQNA